MKLAVLGLWHLGCVTAACCASHFKVTGIDPDSANIAKLKKGQAPLFEPGLDALIATGLAAGNLQFTTDIAKACADADILWVTFDTPVDEDDRGDTKPVLEFLRQCIPVLPRGALVLLSSQLPVGTCAVLEKEFGSEGYRFACSPENLRLGKAIEIFTRADRIIAGCREENTKVQLTELFAPFTTEVIWMRPESAEMSKHAINSFLALSITFMNELSVLCEHTGADAKEVERALKSESRIGPKAYLSPGGAFAGGTLARDVVTCIKFAEKFKEPLAIFPAIKQSNDRHRLWALRKLEQQFSRPPHGMIVLLGLTYKPGTDTLRRSSAIELAHLLHARGFNVGAVDPCIKSLPVELGFIKMYDTLDAIGSEVAAFVVCTEWPEFEEYPRWPALVSATNLPIVVDATRLLSVALKSVPNLTYLTVGSPA